MHFSPRNPNYFSVPLKFGLRGVYCSRFESMAWFDPISLYGLINGHREARGPTWAHVVGATIAEWTILQTEHDLQNIAYITNTTLAIMLARSVQCIGV